jgi:hypothetical protein
MTKTALNGRDERTTALRETVSELLKMEEPRKRYAAMMSGLDVRHDLGCRRRARTSCYLDAFDCQTC